MMQLLQSEEELSAVKMNRPVKLSLFGPAGVGKSSLVLQLTTWTFPEEYDPTIADSYKMDYAINGETIALDILESATALEEHSVDMRPNYMRSSDAIIVVADLNLTNSRSPNDVEYDMRDIFHLFDRAFDSVFAERIPPVTIWASKSDLFGEKRQECLDAGKGALKSAINRLQNKEFASTVLEPEVEKIVLVSAKTRDGLDAALQDIVMRALQFIRRGDSTSTKHSGTTKQIKKTNRCLLS